MDLELTYIGTATMLIELDGLRLLTDPVLGPAGRTVTFLPLATSEHNVAPRLPECGLSDVHAVLLSHDQHEDNLDEQGRAFLRGARPVYTTKRGAKRLGPPAHGLAPGDSIRMSTPHGNGVLLTATYAQHGPRWAVPLAGPVIGFHLAWKGGSLWITGDTVYTTSLSETGTRLGVDILVPHLGAACLAPSGPVRYTMNASEGARLAREVGARIVVPLHYEGWSHFSEGRAEVESALEQIGGLETVWLEAGTPTTFSGRTDG